MMTNLERAYRYLLEANECIAKYNRENKQKGTLRLEIDGERLLIRFRYHNMRCQEVCGFTQLEMSQINPLTSIIEKVLKQVAFMRSDAGKKALKVRQPLDGRKNRMNRRAQ